MHETIDIVVEFDECTVTGDLGYLALDHVADLEMCFNFVPWVGGELLHAERNALAICIHVENGCIDFVAFLHHLGWVIDLTSPRHVGNVHHTVNTFFEFDESTIGCEVANLTTDTGTHWIVMAGHFPRISL